MAVVSPRGDHPAFARFRECDDGSSRLLIIRAAAGTGRRAFAASWIGDREGEVLDWSSETGDQSAMVSELATRLRKAPSLHLAVVVGSAARVLELAAYTTTVVAEQQDLLLEVDEIPQLAQAGRDLGVEESREIYRLCGGWLRAAQLLALGNASDSGSPAQQAIRSSLSTWLHHLDPYATLSEASFLPDFDANLMEAFYGDFSPVMHNADDLVDAGLLRPDENGKWMMPIMVRQVLVERVGLLGRERVTVLEQAAVDAIAEVHGVPEATHSALKRRSWQVLMNLLLEHWADMYMNNPRHLGAIASKVPRFISGRTEYMRVGLRILSWAGKNGMNLQLPAVKPVYATDPLVQRLHRDRTRLYRKPNARALTVGLLEITHLRMIGLYVESAAAAMLLREALARVVDSQNLKPSLAAIVELHAGISLQLAARGTEARQAYEASFHWAQMSGSSFMIADVTGKLALLNSMEDENVRTLEWLSEHDAAIGKVDWGRRMLARSATMARAYVAADGLDIETVGEELATLPATPDNDELWAVHVHLLGLHRIHSGIPETVRSLVETIRAERRNAAVAPLAEQLLDDVLLMAALRERGGAWLAGEEGQHDPTLVALGHLVDDRPHAALSVLQQHARVSGIGRRGNLAMYLRIAARNPGNPTSQSLQQVQKLYNVMGNLAEIAWLQMVPGWGEASRCLDLDSEERERLASVGSSCLNQLPRRPSLTVREGEILEQLRAGKTRRQIAEAGYRSENTVKTQMRSLYRKLEASSLEQALDQARDWGL